MGLSPRTRDRNRRAARSSAGACSARGSALCTAGRPLSIELKHPAGVVQGVDEAVDLPGRVVDTEAGAGGGRHAEPLHQHLGAVVSRPDAYRVTIEYLGHVVRVDALELERDDRAAAPSGRGAED